MARQPRVDEQWSDVLAHRPSEVRASVARRFVECGVTAEAVARVLEDGGDALYIAARSGSDDWSDQFGGSLAVALLAAEVSALAAHLNSRASAVRALAVNHLLDDFSAITVADQLGVSRQQVYEVSRGAIDKPYLSRVPWRTKR